MSAQDDRVTAAELAEVERQCGETRRRPGYTLGENVTPIVERLAREVTTLRGAVATLRAERDGYKDNCANFAHQYDALRANLAALREKARALFPVDNGIVIPPYDRLSALRAELDKPSGADLLAVLDAWKALAQALDRQSLADAPSPEYFAACEDEERARERLRILGENPEEP